MTVWKPEPYLVLDSELPSKAPVGTEQNPFQSGGPAERLQVRERGRMVILGRGCHVSWGCHSWCQFWCHLVLQNGVIFRAWAANKRKGVAQNPDLS